MKSKQLVCSWSSSWCRFSSFSSISGLLWTVKIHTLSTSKMTSLFFFSDLTVIAGDLRSSLLTHLIVASWKSPGAQHYLISPFVSKVVKGVSISFLLLSKTLSWVSSSLFTLKMRYWQRCRCIDFFWVEFKFRCLKAFYSQYLANIFDALFLEACRQRDFIEKGFI